MSCSSIFSTVDQGRVHIATGVQYQGSINSYNWWFTKFFAQLFGWSIDVQMGSKTRRLNTKSYTQFLTAHGIAATSTTIATYKNFGSIPFVYDQDKGMMRNYLSASKVNQLTEKMVKSIAARDNDLALKFLHKGASVDTLFWKRDFDNKLGFTPSFTHDLPRQRIPPFATYEMTPFIYANFVGLFAFARELQAFGADIHKLGNAYSFSREILTVTNDSTLQPTIDPVLVETRRRRHAPPHLAVRHRVGLAVERSQNITFQDTLEKTHHLTLDQLNVLTRFPTNQPPKVTVWESSTVMGHSRLF